MKHCGKLYKRCETKKFVNFRVQRRTLKKPCLYPEALRRVVRLKKRFVVPLKSYTLITAILTKEQKSPHGAKK